MMAEGACAELKRIVDENPLLGERAEWFARIDALDGVEECIRDGLVNARSAEDWSRFGRYVLAVTRHPSLSVTPVLCEVLMLRSDRVNCEDIVEAMGVVGDPSSVSCLLDALMWQPEWDEFHHLAVKCIWALGAIGSDEAIDAIRDAASVGPSVVREAAAHELARLGIQDGG
jgi:hypothetical protein